MQRLKTLPRTHRKEASGIPACLSPKANWVVHVALPCESLGHPGCRCARSLAGKKSALGATLETRAIGTRDWRSQTRAKGRRRPLKQLLQLRNFSVRPNCSSCGRHTGEPEPAKSCRR